MKRKEQEDDRDREQKHHSPNKDKDMTNSVKAQSEHINVSHRKSTACLLFSSVDKEEEKK